MWRFERLAGCHPERDPREGEFFSREDAATSVAREAIQNSLDARLDGSDLLVRFSLLRIPNSRIYPYFEDLIPHLDSCGLLPEDWSTHGDIPVLLIEDFGTRGLDGYTVSMEHAGNSNFYGFWWREGKSGKGGQQGGRWGLGKTVFYTSSLLRTYWGLTIRADDRKRLLMGKAMLKTRWLGGVQYDYAAYYKQSGGEDRNPIADASKIEAFCSDFRLTRDDCSGLSIVIPMITDGISTDALTRAVISQYFFPILKSRLVVEICEGTTTVRLDESTISELAITQDWSDTPWRNQDVHSLITFVENAATVPDGDFVRLHPTGLNVEEEHFGGSIDQVRASLNEGRFIALRIYLDITPKGKPAEKTFFDIFLQQYEAMGRSDEHYIRSGITVTDVRKRVKKSGIRALLYAEDAAISRFLGDAESPAHTDWVERTEDFIAKYSRARPTLKFVKNSIQAVVRILDRPPAGTNPDLLKSIFHLATQAPTNGKEAGGEPTTKVPVLPPQKSPLRISPLMGGFRLSLVDPESVALPISATVRLAYNVRAGNPLKRYHPFDFDLGAGSIVYEVGGGEVRAAKRNEMSIRIDERDFQLHVTGFDRHRDLVVDASCETSP